MPVKINISGDDVEAKVKSAWEKILYALSSEILGDCNEYCKEDTGALIASSNTHSLPQEGLLIWQTPYAKRQYWEIETSLKPGRTWKWCETAKNKHKSDWDKRAENFIRSVL